MAAHFGQPAAKCAGAWGCTTQAATATAAACLGELERACTPLLYVGRAEVVTPAASCACVTPAQSLVGPHSGLRVQPPLRLSSERLVSIMGERLRLCSRCGPCQSEAGCTALRRSRTQQAPESRVLSHSKFRKCLAAACCAWPSLCSSAPLAPVLAQSPGALQSPSREPRSCQALSWQAALVAPRTPRLWRRAAERGGAAAQCWRSGARVGEAWRSKSGARDEREAEWG